jgi:hypothetical protein
MKQKLNARVVKTASGTEIFVTSNPEDEVQVNTVMHFPPNWEAESGLFNLDLTLTPVEIVAAPVTPNVTAATKKDETVKV